jgi:ribosome maturation factor RimP
MTALDNELQNLLSPVVTALGYELVGVVRLSQGRHQMLLRVYIDSPDGIKIEDCERVSYQVSGVLDVHDPIAKEYTLEVSSPGLDRPLFTLEHFIQFIGHQAKVSLARPMEGRRHFTGILQRVQDRNVIVSVEGMEYLLPYDQIDKAHLVPSF